jgi:metal-responsive CopG/Arc/MetJ family transcriptional regulator
MGPAVKKTISLPKEIADEVDALAREEGRSVSAVIQEAWRTARAERLRGRLRDAQRYWARLARDRGIVTERHMARYLAK